MRTPILQPLALESSCKEGLAWARSLTSSLNATGMFTFRVFPHVLPSTRNALPSPPIPPSSLPSPSNTLVLLIFPDQHPPPPVELKASFPQLSCNLLCIRHQSIYPIIVKYLYLTPPLGWESSEGLCLAPSRCSTYRGHGRLPPIRPRAGEHGRICHSGWGYRRSPH